jgi:hypothetical protein
MPIEKEGIINTLFFIGALIVLLINNFGPLTIPGILMALVCVYSIYKKRYHISAILALAAAAGSFLAQSLTVFCPYCTLAATLFILGGLVGFTIEPPQKPLTIISLFGLSLISILLLINLLPEYHQSPIIAQQTTVARAVNEKPRLYFSPDCHSCEDVLQQFIESDPQGLMWQPVVTPNTSLVRGEIILKEKGYTGEVISVSTSPTKFVPVLQVNDQLYRGKEIAPNKLEGSTQFE